MSTLQSIASQLTNGEKCVAFMEVGWVRDIVKIPRILSLVEKQGEFALFVFIANKNTANLSLDFILPINETFKLEDGNSWISTDDSDTFVKISSDKEKYVFQLSDTPQRDNFLLSLNKALDDLHRKPGKQLTFSWLQGYQCQGIAQYSQSVLNMFDPFTPNAATEKQTKFHVECKFDDNFGDKDDENSFTNQETSSQDPLLSFPRQTIAMGEAPLAGREGIILVTMDKRKSEYTNTSFARIFVGTWNVNGQCPTISLADWLACDNDAPDVYAIGFQELDLSKEAFLFNDSPREGEWLNAVKNGLHPDFQYKMVKLVRLVGMMLIIFVKEEFANTITNVSSATVGTGIMGKLGNKGGVAVRLELHNTSICFVNCHLAANPEEHERRNQDFRDISAKTNFTQFSTPKSIQNHDLIFWLGDLNYRIMDVDERVMKRCIELNNFEDVLKYDQLKAQQRGNLAFSGYVEGPIAFPPSYKYHLGVDTLHPGRSPAWCDRILWKGEGINQIIYRSHPSLRISDHKPVSSVFNCDVKVIDVVKFRALYELVMRQLDKLENEFLPQVTVDSMNITFGVVKFIEPQKRYLTIANTGQVPVRFKFIHKPKDKMYCKPWLSIKPCADFIMPGDKCDVELEVYVDKQTAFKLNCQDDRIDDILVLHLENGKDLFITVNGLYQPSSFGCSLESLVHIKVPVMEISEHHLAERVKRNYSIDADAYDIPKEIWRMVDHLAKLSLQEAHLFEQPGLPQEILQIRDCLDTYMSSSLPGNSHSVAEALLVFLEAIPEPVIPCAFYQKCIDAAPNFQLCKQIISQIPPVHRNVFKYLMAFLRLLLSQCEINKLDHKTIATLFGSILLRPANDDKVPLNKRSMHQLIDRKKATFIYHFLANDYI